MLVLVRGEMSTLVNSKTKQVKSRSHRATSRIHTTYRTSFALHNRITDQGEEIVLEDFGGVIGTCTGVGEPPWTVRFLQSKKRVKKCTSAFISALSGRIRMQT